MELLTASGSLVIAAARQEIEYLRRRYARACDLICENTAESIAAGDAIYQRIFTPDADITVIVGGREVLSACGPQQWTAMVIDALCGTFLATQHLIGTQIVDVHRLPGGDRAGGEASMTSYLQAWHAGEDGTLDIFIGTYHDQVRFTPDVGWQIQRMRLVRISGEVRELGGDGEASFLTR